MKLVIGSSVRNELNILFGLNKFFASLPGIEVKFKDQYSNQKENC